MLTQIFLHNVNFSARRQKTGNVAIPSLLTSSPIAGYQFSPGSLRMACHPKLASRERRVVELNGIEPMTSSLQSSRSPN